jgi:PAS domain S-box-containing protein
MLATCGQAELLAIIETFGVPAFVVDVTGHGHFHCVAFNRRHRDGPGTNRLLPAESHYRQCVDAAAPVEYEEERGWVGSGRRWRTVLVPLIDSAGRVVRLLGTVTDIADRNPAEVKRLDRLGHGERLAHSLCDALSDLIVTGPDRSGKCRFEAQAPTEAVGSSNSGGVVPSGVVEIGANGRILFANSVFDSILEFRPGMAVGRCLFDMERGATPRRNLPDHLAFLNAAGASASPYVTTILTASGRGVELQFDWSCKGDEAGRVTGHIAVVTNVTVRERAECEFNRTRELYRSVLDGQRELICRFLPDGTLTYANETYARVVGRPAEDLIGVHFPDFLPAGEREAIMARFAGWRDDCGPIEGEYRLVHTDGTARWVRWNHQPLLDEVVGLVGFQAVGVDVTDQRHLQEQLERSRELFALAVKATRDGIWDWDLRSGRFWLSPQWKAQLGYRDDELENSFQTWADLILDMDRVEALRRLDDYNSGRIASFEHIQRYRHREGRIVYIFNRAIHEKDEHGTVVRLVGAHTDITAQKTIEEDLRRTRQRLRDAIDSISEGFAVFDADDRLVLYNDEYINTTPYLLGFANPVGVTFEEILKAGLERRQIADAKALLDPEAWLAERLRAHCDPPDMPVEIRLADGRWLRISERRTRDGGIVAVKTDITRLKEQETLLRESERRMKVILDTAADAIITIDSRGRVRDFNKAAERIFGYAAADIVGKSVDTLMPAGDSVDHRVQIDRYIRTGQSRIIGIGREVKGRRSDGVEIDLELALSEVVGGETLFTGILRDVTDRNRAQRALRDSETQFRAMAESVPGVICQWYERSNGERGYNYVSPRCETVFGVSAEALQQDWTRLPLHPDDRHRCEASIRRAVAKRADWSFEGRFIAPTGEVRWWRGMAKPVSASEDELVFNGVFIDIMAQKEAEAALVESEQRFRVLADHATDLVSLHTPDGVFLYVSPSSINLLGYCPEELIGRTSFDLIHPDDREQVRQTLAEIHERGTISATYRLRHRNGDWLWFETMGAALKVQGEGRSSGFLSASREVTERVRYERELRNAHDRMEEQAEKLAALAIDLDKERRVAEQASRAKSQFLAMMSHELRTPMTGVMGMVDLLLGSRLTDEQGGLVQTLRSSAKTLLTILNDILDFSKIEAGQLEIEEIDFEWRKVVDDVMQLFEPRASEKGLMLYADLPPTAPAVVRGDPTRLRQVLFNLVGNAIKFTEAGRVDIRLAGYDLAGDALDLEFEVADTGLGISREQQNRLFEAFVQADASTTRRFGGTGLGLAICKQLVEAMGGDISVESDSGTGSVFRFRIRVRPGDPAAIRAEAPDIPAGEIAGLSRNILLAEDNAINRMLIIRMLERMGHRVDTVSNGVAAVEAVGAGSYDLVLMDMQMPVMDGATATREVRLLPGPQAGIPILALTADAIPNHRDEYLRTGLDGYLTKPVDWVQLARAIADLTGGAGLPPGAGEKADADPLPAPETDNFQNVPIIDDAKLDDLRKAVGSSFELMMNLFRESAREEFDALRSALAGGDTVTMRRAAHTLKGVAANLGANRIQVIARRIEVVAADPAAVERLLEPLDRAIEITASRIGELV